MTDLAVMDSIAPRWAARRQLEFQVLGAFFVGNALLAERIGGKLFQLFMPWHAFTRRCGVILRPFVFVMTSIGGYTFEFPIAVAFTPAICGPHGVIHQYLGPAADVDSEVAW